MLRALSMAEEACEGTRRRRRRGRKDQVLDEPAAGGSRCGKTRKKQRKQGTTSTCLVTCVPYFDEYQWRKYGHKQIEGAMYPRSYYRCTRSAEQGCLAKRTVQRNDDDRCTTEEGSPQYTVVYMGEHTCSPNDPSMEEAPPVILETAAAAAVLPDPAAAVGYCSSPPATTTSVGTTGTAESPATSDVTSSSAANNQEQQKQHVIDDGGCTTTGCSPWTTSLLAQDMDDFTGPIRSPVHVAAAGGCWTIEQQSLLLMHLVNDPIISHFSAGFSDFL